MDQIKRLRETRGETGKEVHEIYSRSPKSILQVGDSASSGWAAALGLDLELTPGENPYALTWSEADKSFSPLPIVLSFHDKPLVNALVSAINLDAPPRDESDVSNSLRGRTDENGRVQLRLPRAGRWLVASVHMRALEVRDQADFESFWASLTFEVTPAGR